MKVIVQLLSIVLGALIATPSQAAILCAKKSGGVVLREACRKKEAPVDPAQLGLVGPKGDPGPFPGVLPPGNTVRGRYVIRYSATGPEAIGGDGISFGFLFASPPLPHFVAQGGVPPSECPGNAANPQALAGHLCIYESIQTNRALPVVFDVIANVGVANTFGADIVTNSLASGAVGSQGSWAATSP